MKTQVTESNPTENQLIDEQVKSCKLELVEGEGRKKGRVFARGEFGHAANPTANKRLYRPQVWESNFARLKSSLDEKKVLGELDHPESGRTALQRASHVVTFLSLEGDVVKGEAEILDTAKGKDLKAILGAGVPVGVSSRGYGSTKINKDGIEEVQDDYKLVTFDFVAEPADPTAYPEIVFESGRGEDLQSASMLFEGFDVGSEHSVSVSSEESGDVEDVVDADGASSGDSDRTGDVEQTSEKADGVEVASELCQSSSDEEKGVIYVDALREEFANEIVSRIGALRSDVEAAVRAEMASDPEIGGAKAVLEQIKSIIRPHVLTEGDSAIISEKDSEIQALRSEIQDLRSQRGELELKIEGYVAAIEKLAAAAKEAGYRFHLERLLHEDDSDAKRIRKIVGNVSQYENPDDLRSVVEKARNEMRAFRIEEEKVLGRNKELTEELEKVREANRDLELRVYASTALQNHPKSARIFRMLERTGMQSKEHIDAFIEEFREPERGPDDLERVRSRVRAQLCGGLEHRDESAESVRGNGVERDYNGLGASLTDLQHLAGLRRG